jgi:tetratricopeptide (TPR) repeat protein
MQLARFPADAFATFKLADSYLADGRLPAASSLLNSAFRNRSLPLEAKLQYLERLYSRTSNPGTANLATDLSAILIEQYPQSAALQALVNRQASSDTNPEAARTYLNQALIENPLEQTNWEKLLAADRAIGRYDWLQEDAERALEVFPNLASFNLDYATGAFYLYDYPLAVRYLERFLLIGSTDNALLLEAEGLLGQSYQFLGDAAQSDAHLEAALTLAPSDAITQARLAYVIGLRGGRNEDAAKALARANRDEPTHPEVLRAEGLLRYNEGKLEAALSAFEAAYTVDPNARTANHLGDTHAQLGNVERATYFWNEAKAKGLPDDRLDQKIRTGKL